MTHTTTLEKEFVSPSDLQIYFLKQRPHLALTGLFMYKEVVLILDIYFETTEILNNVLVIKQFANF